MKLFDRLIDHVVDRVMARAKQNEREDRIRAKANRPLTFGNTVVHNINVPDSDIKSGMAAAAAEGRRLAKAFSSGIAGGPAPKQHPGRTA